MHTAIPRKIRKKLAPLLASVSLHFVFWGVSEILERQLGRETVQAITTRRRVKNRLLPASRIRHFNSKSIDAISPRFLAFFGLFLD